MDLDLFVFGIRGGWIECNRQTLRKTSKHPFLYIRYVRTLGSRNDDSYYLDLKCYTTVNKRWVGSSPSQPNISYHPFTVESLHSSSLTAASYWHHQRRNCVPASKFLRAFVSAVEILYTNMLYAHGATITESSNSKARPAGYNHALINRGPTPRMSRTFFMAYILTGIRMW